MDFVDKQNRLGLFLELRQQRLEPLLEIAAVFGASDQGAQIQGIDRAFGQDFGHLAIDDLFGQPLGDGRLAHAGFSNQQGVVLASAAQYLDGALHFTAAPDEWIDLAGLGQFIEIFRELVQRVGRAGLSILGFAGAASGDRIGLVVELGNAMGNVVDHVQPAHILLIQQEHRVRILFTEDRHQHVCPGDFLFSR